MLIPATVKILLPLVQTWCEAQERIILRDGAGLTPAQLTDAQKIGVAHPEKVRLLMVPEIPTPQHPLLVAAIKKVWNGSQVTKGLTLRYGIFIRAEFGNDRELVFHELVHTMQYERMGGYREFLRQYLTECLTVGYPAAPMERAAINLTAEMCPSPTAQPSP